MHPTIRNAFRPALLLFAAFLLINNVGVQAASEEPDYSKVRSGMLFLLGEHEALDAVITRSRVRMHIAGTVADVQMVQDFRNTTDQWINGEYVFPLPSKAAVRNMTILVGERRIEGRIRERQAAEREFQLARDQGRVAAVVRRAQSNLFRASIANIAPGETVSVELNYYQTVEQDDTVHSLNLPMTLTPRYNPKYPSSDEGFDNPPAMAADHPSAPVFEFSAKFSSSVPLKGIVSDSHELTQQEKNGEYLVSLESANAPMNRDFHLAWQTQTEQRPSAQIFTRSDTEQRLAMLVLTPPSPPAAPNEIEREIVFVIDTSGSMAGASLRAAKTALSSALDTLHPRTRFNIIRFDDQAEMLNTDTLVADARGRARAHQFIHRLQADGGTEISNALYMAFQGQRQGVLRQIVFMTDGSVSNERQLLKLIERLRGEARLFPIAIGSAPNRHFLGLAAKIGRGTMTTIDDNTDIAERLDVLARKLSNPALTDLQITDPVSGKRLTRFGSRDLYFGETLSQYFTLSEDTQSVLVEGRIGEQDWTQTLAIEAALPAPKGVASLWAGQTIAQLLEDQWMSEQVDKHKATITELSLRNEILSPYTAFLAAENIVSRPSHAPASTQHVPNLLPAGTESRQHLPLPQGGVGLGLRWVIGLLLLSIAGVLMRFPGRYA